MVEGRCRRSPVYAVMIEEAGVFDGNDGVAEVGADLVVSEGELPLVIGGDEGGEGEAGAVFDEGAGGGGVVDPVGIGPEGDGGGKGEAGEEGCEGEREEGSR